MKKLTKFLLLILLVCTLGILNVNAANTLSISDNSSYDETTGVFTVSGTSTYGEVMVSLFEGDQLLTFKTVSSDHNEYMTTFNILFDSDKTITIKVGDINKTNYKIKTVNVKKSNLPPVLRNVISDDQGNSLTKLESMAEFEDGDNLIVEIEADFSNLNAEEQALFNAFSNALGPKRQLVAVMNVFVRNGPNDVQLPDTNKKYKLVLGIDENSMNGLNKPYAARITDFDHFGLEKGIKMAYSESDNGVPLYINNIGTYLLYEDLNVEYKQKNNKDYVEYYLKDGKDLTITIDADFSKFQAVYMDDKLVDPKNYDAKDGSTVITFKKAYMQSLSEGSHTIVVDFSDGESVIALSVINSTNPNTGDYIMYYLFLGIVSVVGFVIGFITLKKKSINK